MEPPSATQALGVNPLPSRFINRTVPCMRGFRALIEERANENREMTADSRRIFSRALKKKMVLFITILGKGLTQESNGDGNSI